MTGLASAVKPALSAGALQKFRFQKHLFWSEKSIRERKFRDRGSQISQVERLHGVLGEDTTFSFHSRVHFPGTNRGDALGPITAPKWDEPWLFKSNNSILFLGYFLPTTP